MLVKLKLIKMVLGLVGGGVLDLEIGEMFGLDCVVEVVLVLELIGCSGKVLL